MTILKNKSSRRERIGEDEKDRKQENLEARKLKKGAAARLSPFERGLAHFFTFIFAIRKCYRG
jgi:hypothetical protein